MKGLILKDLMCLRKQRMLFIYIVICVLALSIMYVLSARFGNIAKAGNLMSTENGLSEMDVKNIGTNALILFMLLPISMVGDVSSVLIADGKADFMKVSASFPLSIEKRVLAKYLTVLIMFGMGVGVDVCISFILSCLTDLISFYEFFGIIISAASVILLYGALTLVYSFLFGYGKESHAQVASFMTMIAGLVLVKFRFFKGIFIQVFLEDEVAGDINMVDDFMRFIKYKSYYLFLIALATACVSYVLAVVIAKRKRGIV